MNAVDFEFVPPPEAPVFEPTVEEFKDPLAYIAKIRPVAEQTGICKIKPPPATTRVKLNFLDQIAKFWELQGSSLKIPNVERKALDLFTLYRVVLEEGGSEIVSRERRWSRIATRMGYPPGRGVGSLLRQHYERILYPYHVFQEGTSIGDLNFNEDSDDSSQQDKDYIPHGIPSRQAIKPPVDRYARRSKRCKETEENLDGIDYSTNNELKKLQFYGAGPKMPGYHIQGHFETEEESKAFLKENHVECFKDVKMGLGAKDLKMGFGTKLTGSFLKETKTMEEVEAVKLGVILKRKDKPRGKMPIDQIVCNICGRGDEEASMLLCDGCDDSYHTFCLIPPLSEIPKGDWRCPCCVAKEVNKPQEAFGFEQAQREKGLRVPYSHVEKEFWRIVNAVDEDVTVEYGADLHTIEHGSGFPNMKTKDLMPGDEEYVTSGWNLNNLPVLEGSVLKHINADISGMKIPWTYVGMCFATFCWHNEDHWSYSINYLHWGEPKTWYGVPGGKAEAFEEAMRSVAPELFTAQPDLLHQLVTIMNPNLLISQGVPIFRTNQQAGEFVITFPRSYHAGFNQGYNFAEAVNFAPADWLLAMRNMSRINICQVNTIPRSTSVRYRYTLDELPTMLYRLKVRAESFDCWSTKVQNALNAESKNKLGISELKELMLEAEEKRFPCTDLLQNLNATIDEGEKCAALAQQLLSRRIRTRTRQCGEVRSSSRLTLEDLHLFHQQLSTLACEIKEAFHVKDLLDRAVAFQVEAQEILAEERPDSRRLEKCMEVGINLDIEIPEICQLKQKLEQSRWLEEVRGVLLHPDRVTLQVLGGLLERGVCIPPDPTVEKVMAELQELLTFGEKWEEKARSCLQAKPKHPLSLVEAVVRDAGNISVHLPNVLQLTEAVRKAKEWLHKVQLIQNEAHNPYLEVLEQLVWKGRPVPIRLEQLSQIETQVEAARAWKEKTARTFLKKNSSYSLLEVLSPRKDIGMSPKNKKKRKELDDSEDSIEAKMEEIKDPATIVAHFREAERRELEAMILLRAKNERKRSEDRPESRYCICHKPYSSGMVQCELCKDCFHVQCMPPSRTVPSGRKGGQTGGRWLCGCCLRSRRPRLETILSLLMALQKLPVRLAEGEALQCLTERGMAWQDRAKQALKSEENFKKCPIQLKINLKIYCKDGETSSPQISVKAKELPVPETPPKIETVDLTGESAHTDTEHAYSSASKTAAATVTPRKHARKSPLVARQMESPVLQLSESVRQQLEQLLMEGDLLEMSLDESGDIWRILQATRADFSLSPFSDIEENVRIEKKKTKKIKLEETRSNILKSKVTKTKKPEKQRRKKLRLEGGEMKRPKPRSGEFHFQKEMKDGSVKTVKMRAKLFDSKKPRRKGEQRRDKEGEDFCSAAGCLRPIGEAVNWVQCDGGCEQWFHLLCVGLDMSEVSETEDYICPNCARQSKDEQAYSEESDASEEHSIDTLPFFDRSITDLSKKKN
ncbi:Lysine-specific demethylase 5C like protein [Argiope bruennichi]|uniref:Lysine-specific demethylase 5C like protein n=1 Tax=Argiope bruennichi TaxID=94029 RepID=A0A8T0E4U7_ARGBR|nr:Lysine-specific demethylase 5C like protein [Argiope bruennichi]